MTFWRTLLAALVIGPSFYPTATFAASKEIVELQRDLALLQEQVRSMQRSQDEKFSAIQTLVQQALDSANKTSTSVALLQNNLLQSFKDQQKSVVDPVVGVGAKLDQMTTDVGALRESVADISSQMGKLQQQMIDIGNAVRTIQTPAAAPPAAVQPGVGSAGAPRPAMFRRSPAATLYQNANRDRNGGNDDLALKEYSDYLKYYGNTDFGAECAVLYCGTARQTGQPGSGSRGVRHGPGKISGQQQNARCPIYEGRNAGEDGQAHAGQAGVLRTGEAISLQRPGRQGADASEVVGPHLRRRNSGPPQENVSRTGLPACPFARSIFHTNQKQPLGRRGRTGPVRASGIQ